MEYFLSTFLVCVSGGYSILMFKSFMVINFWMSPDSNILERVVLQSDLNYFKYNMLLPVEKYRGMSWLSVSKTFCTSFYLGKSLK